MKTCWRCGARFEGDFLPTIRPAGIGQEWRDRWSQVCGECVQKHDERKRARLLGEWFFRALVTLDPYQRDPAEKARALLKADPTLGDDAPEADFSAERARRCAEVLRRYADLKEEREP